MSDRIPLGILYVANELLKAGYRPDVINANGLSNYNILNIIKRKDYDIVGISALSTSYSYVEEIASMVKHVNSDCKVVVGNALATFSSELVLNNTDVDICVLGEGDVAFKEIVESVDDLSNIKGIVFKNKKGNVVKNPPRTPIKDLDSFSPSWELMDIKDNNDKTLPGFSFLNFNILPIVTSRGCPYNCGFCSKVFRNVRYRSVDNVVDEIKFLKDNYNIEAVDFCDEMLTANKKRLYELCDKLKPLEIKWKCQTRVNHVSFEILKYMKDAGCVAVAYGVESGSQTILTNMNKQITPKQIKNAIQAAYDAKLHITTHMIFGYFGENKKTINETIDLFRDVGNIVDNISCSWITPLPGSRAYSQAIKTGLIDDELQYLKKISGSGFLHETSKIYHVINLTKVDTSMICDLVEDAERKLLSYGQKGVLRKWWRRLTDVSYIKIVFNQLPRLLCRN